MPTLCQLYATLHDSRMRRSTRVTTNAIVINRMSTTMPVGGGGSRDDDSDESEYSDSDSEDDQRRRTAARPVVQERVKRRRTYRPPCYAIGSFRAGNVDLLTLSQQQQQQPVQQPVQMAVTATPGVPSAQLRQQMEQQEKQRQLLLAEQVRMMSQSETLGSYNIPLPPPSNGVYQSPTIPSRTERVPYRTFKPRPTTDEERQILEKLEKTANISKLPESMSPPKNHRGFGASANKFNEDGSVEVGEFRSKWRCTWCLLSGKFTPTLRRGPMGSKVGEACRGVVLVSRSH